MIADITNNFFAFLCAELVISAKSYTFSSSFGLTELLMLGFDAGNRNVELQTCTLPQSHALETVPLGLFTDMHSPFRNDNDQQNASMQTTNQCEKKVTIDRCFDLRNK